MNRRGFLGTLLAPLVARYVPPSVFRWKRVGPTIGAIDRATFHFWRNRQVYGDGDACKHVIYHVNMMCDSPSRLGVITGITE